MDTVECRRSILGTKRAFGAYPSLHLHLICTHSIPLDILSREIEPTISLNNFRCPQHEKLAKRLQYSAIPGPSSERKLSGGRFDVWVTTDYNKEGTRLRLQPAA